MQKAAFASANSKQIAKFFGVSPYNYKDPLNFSSLLTSEEKQARMMILTILDFRADP